MTTVIYNPKRPEYICKGIWAVLQFTRDIYISQDSFYLVVMRPPYSVAPKPTQPTARCSLSTKCILPKILHELLSGVLSKPHALLRNFEEKFDFPSARSSRTIKRNRASAYLPVSQAFQLDLNQGIR